MSTYYTFRNLIIAASCSIFCFMTGCDSGSDAPPQTVKTYPGVGSTFEFKKTPLDNNGNAYTPYPDSTRMLVVIEGPHSFAGKDSVITYVENSTDTIRIAMEKDGDISLYMPKGIQWETKSTLRTPQLPVWWPLPVKSGKKIEFASIDTSATIYQGNVGYTFKHFTATSSFISKEGPYYVAEKDATLRKVELVFKYDYDYLNTSGTLTFKYPFIFAEEIGYFTSYSIVNPSFDIDGYLGNYAMTIQKCEWK